MKDFFLTNYSVAGIKSLEKRVNLSFYKKTIRKTVETDGYNVKGIYGVNGSGKSGIIASVDILKRLISDAGYLNNPLIQKKLGALINKEKKELAIEAEFIAYMNDEFLLYSYECALSQNISGRYVLSGERLSYKLATSANASMEVLFDVKDGEITNLKCENDCYLNDALRKRTLNLLSNATMTALFVEQVVRELPENEEKESSSLLTGLLSLAVFGRSIHVFLDVPDDHTNFFINEFYNVKEIYDGKLIDPVISELLVKTVIQPQAFDVSQNVVSKSYYGTFKKYVNGLSDFIKIFKPELQNIEIEKKEDRDAYICNLKMKYADYAVDAEFESTGIKKLIKLYTFFKEMVEGDIVFIDELDSNLHDVYLCALLEYLMNYAKGQLCFTTHNVGPMDILKQNKKSIDFLSVDKTIYSWVKCGNYSPSKLYREGMVVGSPFNVDSIDFIGVFSKGETEK